jgi:hypothetical protein
MIRKTNDDEFVHLVNSVPSGSSKLDPKNLKISLVNRQVADRYQEYDREYQELFVKGRVQ